jgi:NAD-dependent SIR2 family protein deacetylase
MTAETRELIERAAQAVAGAEGMVIGAGAGMGVDSGLPDFRGTEGFWRAYPPYRKLKLDFMDAANPRWFRDDPTLAWGFYGHRLNLYRAAGPHAGFDILRRWAGRMKHGAFVFTSNVDGQFQKAGFDPERIVEVHGSIHSMQCTARCGIGIVSAESHSLTIDEESMRAAEPLPRCPSCGALARPNILMFGDWDWDAERSELQQQRLTAWLSKATDDPLVVVECGAGLAIPTVRRFCEQIVRAAECPFIRINMREADVPVGAIGLKLGALEALRAIDAGGTA